MPKLLLSENREVSNLILGDSFMLKPSLGMVCVPQVAVIPLQVPLAILEGRRSADCR